MWDHVYQLETEKDTRGLVKLGIFYGEGLVFPHGGEAWLQMFFWKNFIGADISTLGVPSLFLYFYWVFFLCLSPEMRRFAYSEIRWEEYEGTPCPSPLGESIIYAYGLTSVGFSYCWIVSPGDSALIQGFSLQLKGLEYLSWHLLPDLE